MRVAFIVNSFPEISEKFLLNSVVGLMDAGVDVTVFAAHRPTESMRHALFEARNVASITRYAEIPRSIKSRFFRAPALFLRLLLRKPKAAIEALNVGKYRTVAKNAKLLYFGNVFLGERFDVAHCQFGVNGLIGAYLKDCGFAGRLVVTFHGSDINTYPKRHGLDVYAWMYRRADLITANTSFTKGKIAANGCPESLIRVLPVGFVAAEYAGVDRSSVQPLSILTVGRLEEKKGHRYLIEAVSLLKKRLPGVKYLIAGGGSLSGELRDMARDRGVDDACEFLGVCSSKEVMGLYGSAAVFCLPSVTASSGDMEGQGLVLQEAQACGVPVVSTLHNGIPDGVLDGISGFLVPEKDPVALAEKIYDILTDIELRDRMGGAGREFALKKYDIAVITAELMGFYREITA